MEQKMKHQQECPPPHPTTRNKNIITHNFRKISSHKTKIYF